MNPEPNTSGRLPLRPKSYVLSVDYKLGFPVPGECVDYNYHDFEQAMAHVEWLADQVRGQNGKEAMRKNVVLGFLLSELLRSKKRDRRYPPIQKFVAPKGRKRPDGGIIRLPEFE